MATNTINKLLGIGRSLASRRLPMTRKYSLYTPDYLEVCSEVKIIQVYGRPRRAMSGKSSIPLHTTLNIQIKSYVYPVLESYQKFIDNLAGNMDIEVDDSWAFPPKCLKITKFKPNTSAVDAEYELKEYERNIQLEDVSATQYPILLRALEASLPEGVTLRVEYWDPLRAEKRYVPDRDLLILKEELDTLQKK